MRAGVLEDWRTGGQEDRRTGGQEDRRTGGQEDRKNMFVVIQNCVNHGCLFGAMRKRSESHLFSTSSVKERKV